MRSFKSNENIHKKEGGSYYVVSANKASSVTLQLKPVLVISTYNQWFRNTLHRIEQTSENRQTITKQKSLWNGTKAQGA